MTGNAQLYNISTLSRDYYRFFEVGLGFFLRDGSKSRFVNNYDYKTYSRYFGGKSDLTTSGTHEGIKGLKYDFHEKLTIFILDKRSPQKLSKSHLLVIHGTTRGNQPLVLSRPKCCIAFLESPYGNKLLIMAISVNTTLQAVSLGYKAGLPVHDSWENFVQSEVCALNSLCTGLVIL